MDEFINSYAFFDVDAADYINRVEQADGDTLEPAVRNAINNFFIGCKSDNIFSPIKACCLFAGPRTRAGARVPLLSTMPTPVEFGTASGWIYNRKTGLRGNGTNNYIDTGRAENADPLSNMSWSVRAESTAVNNQGLIGTVYAANTSLSGAYLLTGSTFIRNRSLDVSGDQVGPGMQTGTLVGTSRSSSSSYTYRYNNTTGNVTAAERTPKSANFFLFAENQATSGFFTGSISFYHIGESLDLALLDARVTALINALAAAIP